MTRTTSNGLQRAREPEESLRSVSQYFSPATPEEDPAHDASNMSIEVWQPRVGTAPGPPELAIIPATPTDTVTVGQPIQYQHFPLQYNSPSHPPSSTRSGSNEDLNRFVSSSTTTATTQTSGSAGSFIKHAGPKQLRRIGPEDVIGALSDKVGQMVLDRQKMKWVKDTALASFTAARERDDDEESEDPFRDFESLRDEDSAHPSEQEEESESRIEEIVEDADDPEEAVLNSFSFDDSSAAICPVMTGVSRPGDENGEDSSVIVDDPLTDSDESLEEFGDYTEQQHEEITDDVSLREFPAPPPRSNAVFSTPLPLRPNTITSAGATPFPSGGRSGTVKSHSVTPVSALKDPNRSKTPAGLKHRRSVSFSDGKRDGPIRGLNVKVAGLADSESGNEKFGKSGTGNMFEPSVRSKRIAGILDGLQDDCKYKSLCTLCIV
jgi:protein NUD1